MLTIQKRFLEITFLLDMLFAIGFGLVSWFMPVQTFGTILALPSSEPDLVLALLSSISIHYILIGILAFIALKAPYPVNFWLAQLMIIRHIWIGIVKINDIGVEWIIGNPYPDIIIHTLFLIFYTIGIFIKKRDVPN